MGSSGQVVISLVWSLVARRVVLDQVHSCFYSTFVVACHGLRGSPSRHGLIVRRAQRRKMCCLHMQRTSCVLPNGLCVSTVRAVCFRARLIVDLLGLLRWHNLPGLYDLEKVFWCSSLAIVSLHVCLTKK